MNRLIVGVRQLGRMSIDRSIGPDRMASGGQTGSKGHGAHFKISSSLKASPTRFGDAGQGRHLSRRLSIRSTHALTQPRPHASTTYTQQGRCSCWYWRRTTCCWRGRGRHKLKHHPAQVNITRSHAYVAGGVYIASRSRSFLIPQSSSHLSRPDPACCAARASSAGVRAWRCP